MSLRGAVCFLVINKILELPQISIQSAIDNTNLPIIVGYVSEQDIVDLQHLPVSFVKINVKNQISVNSEYAAFDQDQFYRIVMNKWELLIQNLPGFDYLIYSDIDVLWIRDAGEQINEIFSAFPNVHLAMQNFGDSEQSPKLCMGFVAIRNSVLGSEFLLKCKERHKELIQVNPRIGDDDIATLLLGEIGFPNWLHRLSQVHFPVGNLLNLFTGRNSFPGIKSPIPYVFHLNYVVGLKNKRLMMRIVSSSNPDWSIDAQLGFKWRLILLLKRIKLNLVQLKKLALK